MSYALHPAVSIIGVDEQKLQIRAVNSHTTIEGQNQKTALLVSELARGVEPDELRARLAAHPQAEELLELLAFFTQQGYVVEAHDLCAGVHDPLLVDVDFVGGREKAVHPPSIAATSVIAAPSASVHGSGRVADETREALADLGIAIVPAGQGAPALHVACTDAGGHEDLRRINREALASRTPVLFAALQGHKALVGPFVVPGETACFECYHHRLSANLAFPEETLAFLGGRAEARTQAAPRLYAREVAFHVASQVAKYTRGLRSLCLFDELLEVDLLNYDLAVRHVLKLPRCPVCRFGGPSPERAVRNLI